MALSGGIFDPSASFLVQPPLLSTDPVDPVAGSSSLRHPLFPFNQSRISPASTFNNPHGEGENQQPSARSRSSSSRRIHQNRQNKKNPTISPPEVLGPLATNPDGSDFPILPQFTYSVLSNGSLLQIPILWTAMSLAMGVEIRGDIIRGLPCIKRLNQLFCPTAGNRYPGDPIDKFIDENKALIRRMYGEFQTPAPGSGDSDSGSTGSSRRSVRQSIHHGSQKDITEDPGTSWARHIRDGELFAEDLEAEGFSPDIYGFGSTGDSVGNGTESSSKSSRPRRQSNNNRSNNRDNKDNKSDACESTVEVVTPFWAANSSGKIRAIVNTQHFEQAVHQEVCSKPRTGRCTGDCSCEQKYKWHRLLAYDPDNDCKGIFMDWFLFPSCCVCRCLPL